MHESRSLRFARLYAMMLIDGIKAEDDEDEGEFKLDLKELFLLAIATSIDALAVGITFTFLNRYLPLWLLHIPEPVRLKVPANFYSIFPGSSQGCCSTECRI